MNPKHISEYIIKPALVALSEYDERMNTKASVDLLMGTCAKESTMGLNLVQLDGGPALGIFQMEPDTHRSIWTHYLSKPKKAKLKDIVLDFLPAHCIMDDEIDPKQLIYHLTYAAAMARIRYWYEPGAIPDNLEGQAAYWKRNYNTERGHGTVEQYIDSYKELVA